MTKILVISPSEFPGKTGASANYTEIVNQLAKEGFNVFLICPKNPASNNQILSISDEVEIIRIPYSPPRLKEFKDKPKISDYVRYLIFLILELFTVLRVVNRKKIKFALVRHELLTIQLPYFLKLFRLKTIADGELMNEVLKNKTKKFFYNFLMRYEKRAVKCYNFFKVSSDGHAKSLQKNGFPKSKILINPIGINLEEIPKFSIDDIPEHTFGYFGVLEEWQGVNLLLEAFDLLSKKLPMAKLYIIGNGSLEDELRDFVTRKNLTSKVIFRSVSREELFNEYFKKFRIVVIPRPKQLDSKDTILPIKLVESLVAGKPTIAMDIPIIRSIPKNPVCIVHSETPNSLAKTMEDLTTNYKMLKEYSQRSLESSINFDIRKTIKILVNAWQNI